MSKFYLFIFTILTIATSSCNSSNHDNAKEMVGKIAYYKNNNFTDSLIVLHDSIIGNNSLCDKIISIAKDSCENLLSFSIATTATPEHAAQITINELLSESSIKNPTQFIKDINNSLSLIYTSEENNYIKSLDSISSSLDIDQQAKLFTLVSTPKKLANKVNLEENCQELIEAIEKQYKNNESALTEFHNTLK
jgi:hypothetical protein